MKRFKNILYVADASGEVLGAFHHAVGLADRNAARLTVILVMEHDPSSLTRRSPLKLRDLRMEALQAALDRHSRWAAGRVEVETKIVEGKPFLEIIREVLHNRRDLVIKSAGPDGGSADWLFGSTDMHLLRKCPCPVWLIKADGPTPLRRIMACVDFDDFDPSGTDTVEPLNRTILEMAGSLAAAEGSGCHVVHAWEAAGEALMRSGRAGIHEADVDAYVKEVRAEHRHWLQRLLGKAGDWLGAETYAAADLKIHLPKGKAADAIPQLAEELAIDLVVMGTVARTGIPGLIIGNTAENMLGRLKCSVLAVKPAGFCTPVELSG